MHCRQCKYLISHSSPIVIPYCRSSITLAKLILLRVPVMNNFAFGSKYAFTVTRVFWRAGAVGAFSFGLLVCGAAVLCMMCLFRLSDMGWRCSGPALHYARQSGSHDWKGIPAQRGCRVAWIVTPFFVPHY